MELKQSRKEFYDKKVSSICGLQTSSLNVSNQADKAVGFSQNIIYGFTSQQD